MKCPNCGKDKPRLLALSRRDNKTMICDECGIREAFEDLEKADMKYIKYNDTIQSNQEDPVEP